MFMYMFVCQIAKRQKAPATVYQIAVHLLVVYDTPRELAATNAMHLMVVAQ